MNKLLKLILTIITIFTLTGCYDHKELNDIALLTATEINKVDNNYLINTQIVNPQAPDKTVSVGAPFVMYQGTGKTIQEAYRMIKLSSPRYIYPEHLRIVIINENLAKENIRELLDFYLRNPLARTEFNILIGKTDNILNITTPIDTLSATSILNTLETSSEYLGITNTVTLNELTEMIINPHTEVVLPSITLKKISSEGDTTENTKSTATDSTYELSSLAIFKDNKLLDYLSNEESITYNLIKNNISSTIINYECEENKYLSYEIISNKSKITTNNGNININLNITGTINESACKLNLNNEENISKLSNTLSDYLKDRITTNINNIISTYNSDIFGFLDIIYKHDYNTYLQVKDNWYNGIFKNLKIEVNPQVKVIAKGNVMEGINEKN